MKNNLRTVCCLILSFLLLTMTACATSYGKTQDLIDAIEAQDASKVTELLNEGLDPNALSGPSKNIFRIINTFAEYSPQAPLAVACSTGNLEIVELLISYGATAEYQEGAGWSPLAETLFYYHPDDLTIVKLLLENGADIKQKEADWLPVFQASRMIPRVYDAQRTNGTVFLEGYDEETANGIVEIVKCLMGDFDINDQTTTKTTLLMNAASVGNYALVEYLLSIGADSTLTDYNGKTAFDHAQEKGYADVAELLESVAE